MNINFTKKQYESLIKICYLGNWIANSMRDDSKKDPSIKEYEKIEQYVYSFAKDFGLEELIDEDEGVYYPTVEMEENTQVDGLIEEYDDRTFWEKLKSELAKKLIRGKYTKKQILKMSNSKRVTEILGIEDDLDKEFSKFGVERLVLDESIKPDMEEDFGENPDGEPYQMLKQDELYYDGMEWLNSGDHKEALACIKKALKIDSEYIQTYVGLVAIYRQLGDFENEKKYVDIGFELTKVKFPKWPARMEWGDMENRAYMRSICDKAMTAQISGDTKMAEELYRLLLKMNPWDNS